MMQNHGHAADGQYGDDEPSYNANMNGNPYGAASPTSRKAGPMWYRTLLNLMVQITTIMQCHKLSMLCFLQRPQSRTKP